jgi:hypothetical protein
MNAQSSAGATNNASASMDSSANATQKATTTKRAAGTNADQMKVASATPRGNSRAPARSTAKSGDTPYRAELRNCVQQSADQRESCLDRAIENHERTQSG